MASKLVLSLLTNSDDVQLFWRPADNAPISGCLGFAIHRKITRNGATTSSYLDNRTGFADAPATPGEHQPSNVWPFQRFSWTDHDTQLGDQVAYTVAPVLLDAGTKKLIVHDDLASAEQSATISSDVGSNTQMFINRGLVMSQFMSRHLAEIQQQKKLTFNQALKYFKTQEIASKGATIRDFLGGVLKQAAVKLLADAKTGGQQVYGALFELSDPEIIAGLCALGPKAHIILADGAQGGTSSAWADENAAARATLRAAKVDVTDRFTRKQPNSANSGKALAHNKFLVVADAKGVPHQVWTGSTNLTPTGFCTQINNAVLLTSDEMAKVYLDQWNRLKGAGNVYPPALVTSNSSAHPIKSFNTDVWFTRTTGGTDMTALQAAVNGAKQGILFLMFMPGPSGLYKTITDLQAKKPGLLIHGVVSQLPTVQGGSPTVILHGAGSTPASRKPYALDIVQPEGIETGFRSWMSTVTRGLFTSQVGHAIVHSKLVVVDPLSASPTVITGSHNFSGAASTTNDENFVIIRGNPKLAAAFSAHIYSVYFHYRWLKYVNATEAAGGTPWGGLARDDKWQAGDLQGSALNELKFWVP